MNQVRQRLPGHILHHHVLVIGVGEDVVNRDDVGVVEAAGRLGLLDETPAPLRVAHRVDRQRLDRHSAVEPWIPGLEDVTHAARAQFFGDLIMRNRPPDHTELYQPEFYQPEFYQSPTASLGRRRRRRSGFSGGRVAHGFDHRRRRARLGQLDDLVRASA